MKNMALDELVLVRPRQFPHPEATARASGADDLLARARVVPDLATRCGGCGLVLATTAASAIRISGWSMRGPRRRRWLRPQRVQPVAVVFGAERTGLTNEELDTRTRCCAFPPIPPMPR